MIKAFFWIMCKTITALYFRAYGFGSEPNCSMRFSAPRCIMSLGFIRKLLESVMSVKLIYVLSSFHMLF